MTTASVIDTTTITAMLLAVVACTIGIKMPISALKKTTAPAFYLMASVLNGCYFIVLDGIVDVTTGEYMTGARAQITKQRRLDLRTVTARTRQSILRNACFIELLSK